MGKFFCAKCKTYQVRSEIDLLDDGMRVFHHGAEEAIGRSRLMADTGGAFVVFLPVWRGWEGFSRKRWPLAESGFRM